MKIICETVEISKAPSSKDYYGNNIELDLSGTSMEALIDSMMEEFVPQDILDYLTIRVERYNQK